jgi:NADPH:quinone reductase-like Zn-dependent oxidoreductase
VLVCGLSYDGGYQEYMIAPEEAVAGLPDGISSDEAAPLLCAGITTFNALRNAASEFVLHFHGERNHQGLDHKLIEPGAEVGQKAGQIVGSSKQEVKGLAKKVEGKVQQKVGDAGAVFVDVREAVEPNDDNRAAVALPMAMSIERTAVEPVGRVVTWRNTCFSLTVVLTPVPS